MDDVRQTILGRLSDLGLDMAEVSKRLGRNSTYVQQFLRYGKPKHLDELTVIRLAAILEIDPDLLRRAELRGLNRKMQLNQVDAASVDHPESVAVRLADASEGEITKSPQSGDIDLPIYGVAEAGEGALVVSDNPVDWVERPLKVLRVDAAYGVIVKGKSMGSRAKPGDIAVVNPHLPARPGDLCIFRAEEHGAVRIKIKEYVGETSKAWKVRQWDPMEDFTLSKAEWTICHRVVHVDFS